jgi:hypothetical protein
LFCIWLDAQGDNRFRGILRISVNPLQLMVEVLLQPPLRPLQCYCTTELHELLSTTPSTTFNTHLHHIGGVALPRSLLRWDILSARPGPSSQVPYSVLHSCDTFPKVSTPRTNQVLQLHSPAQPGPGSAGAKTKLTKMGQMSTQSTINYLPGESSETLTRTDRLKPKPNLHSAV